MTGETDLATILRTLRISRRHGTFTVVSRPGPIELGDGVEAVVAEPQGTAAVVRVTEARRRGWPVEFRAAWLTVDVHTSLEGVGLTAALSTTLADRGIACNLLAGYHHDHLLVPLARADEAVEALEALAG